MRQRLLFPDPKPLVEKLGREFFLHAPEDAGVYLMRDAADNVLYVGKAKNLRRRLGSYRVANPDRMPRRHLRMLRAVTRIELQACAEERAALARESELLRLLKPKFNRAGTWTAPPRFLACRRDGEDLQFMVSENPDSSWLTLGPMGVAANSLRNALVRLLWCALHPGEGARRMPVGWAQGQFPEITSLATGKMMDDCSSSVEEFFSGKPDPLLESLSAQFDGALHPFDQALLRADLEFLSEYASRMIQSKDWQPVGTPART